jgi:hypothetical protein
MSSPLNALTCKDTVWRGGTHPLAALRSFNELCTALCSEPVPYVLIVNTAFGNDKNDGGLGVILCQADEKASSTTLPMLVALFQNMKKITHRFLLNWSFEHFSVYLRGQKFTMYTDHKPLKKLSTVHTKTLN